MQNCDTLVHAACIITQNESREIINNGGIAIAGGRIAAIGAWSEIAAGWQANETLDLSRMLAMPGLLNGHTHAAMTFLRGLADDQPLLDWLQKTVFPIEARLTPEITELASLLGHAEMLATGTTACVDMYIHEDAVLKAASTAGIRCMGGEAVFQFPSAACPDYKSALARTAALAEKYAGSERVKIAVNPHSVYTTTPQILRECRSLALSGDLPLHIHLAETAAETAQCLQAHGKRPVAYCEDLGLFDCRAIAAHLVDITPEEARALAAANVCGCHNPSSNMKLASGAAPVSDLLASGVKMGLGSDGPASNNQMNMFAEMNRAALLQKAFRSDPAAMPAQTVLDMATLGGAAIFGDSGLGRLAPGSHADLIALDLDRPNMLPLHNPVSQAVYAASGHETRLAMIGGEIVYRDGKFSRFDYPALLAEIQKLRDFVAKRT